MNTAYHSSYYRITRLPPRSPARLQRYYFDNLFGSFAAYSLVRYNAQDFVSQPLSHSAVFSSFSTNLIPSFFRGHKFSGLGYARPLGEARVV